MGYTTKDICEILGFKVTCFIYIPNETTREIYYAIRSPIGEVVSQKYQSAIEPMQLLRDIESQVIQPSQ